MDEYTLPPCAPHRCRPRFFKSASIARFFPQFESATASVGNRSVGVRPPDSAAADALSGPPSPRFGWLASPLASSEFENTWRKRKARDWIRVFHRTVFSGICSYLGIYKVRTSYLCCFLRIQSIGIECVVIKLLPGINLLKLDHRPRRECSVKDHF
ncbi:uncharacterized protein LOC135598742 isoform X2 [Musa acuminata AAA Group]|uniref:uncharacterized protein LOC135598742 isoform X2 n=1 Tax=Musa acuminata AAA Group TaxID=214697 RepID=UPI0031CFC1C3